MLDIVPAVELAINTRNRCATVFLLKIVAKNEMKFYKNLCDDMRPMFTDRAKTLGPVVDRLDNCAPWEQLLEYMGISQKNMAAVVTPKNK